MEHQDWNEISWKRPTTATTTIRSNLPKRKQIDTDDPPPPSKISISTGQYLQNARNAKNLTRKQLANKINIKEADIAEVETGNGVLNKSIVRKLANALRVKVKL